MTGYPPPKKCIVCHVAELDVEKAKIGNCICEKCNGDAL